MIEETPERKHRLSFIENGNCIKKDYYKGPDGTALHQQNDQEWRMAEYLSAACLASARGLARLGAYMSNKGTLEGKQIMTEEAWRKFHDGPKLVGD